MTERKPEEALVEENRQLRTRIEALETVLHAIRSGEVDALVLSKPEGEQVLPLRGALEPYRVMVEAMGEGAVSLSADSAILYCNARFAELVRMPREQIAGLPLHDMIAEPDRKRLDKMIARGLKQSMRGELTLLASDGMEIPVQLSMSPLPESDGKTVSVVVTDLTEVTAAAQTRTLLALIVESSDDAIISTTLDGVIESWNQSAEKLYGYTAGEALGQSIDALIVPPGRINEVMHEHEAIRLGEHTLLENTMRMRKDGTLVAVSIKASPILDDAGKVVGSSINARDITERKRVEDERDRVTHLLGERLKELTCLYTVSTILADSGLSVEQCMQRIVETFPPAFQYPEVTCARISLRGRQYRSGDFKETAWRLASAIALEGEEGEEDGELEVFYTEERPASDGGLFLLEERDLVQTVARNVGEFFRLQLATAQLQQFRDLLDDSNDSVFVIDPGTARFMDVNERVCINLEYSRDELLRMAVMDVDDAMPSKSAWDSHVKAVKKAGAMLLEGEHRRKDGSTFPVEVSVKYVSREGNDYIVAIVRDIAERHEKEDEIKFKNTILQTQQETSPDAILVVDEDAQIISYNHQFIDLWRLPPKLVSTGRDEALLQAVSEQIEDLEAFLARVKYLYEHRGEKSHEEVLFKDGRIIDRYSAPMTGADGVYYGRIWYFRDITERKQAEARIAHLNRVLLVLSGINTLIVRVNDRDELFREACNIAVDAGGFRMAMLVIVDPDTKLPVSITSTGKNEELLAEIKNVLSSSEGIQKTLIGQVIGEEKAIISNDIQNDSRLILAKQYTDAGVKSMTVLPLFVEDEAVGVLALYAREIEFFQKDEMKLLSELAGDISFAIGYLDKQARLDYLAYYDVLTGLANRSLFLERVAQHIRSATISGHKLAVGMIDLERFKNINDSLGRPAGDTLLKQVAEWLALNIGDVNLLARIDADHFASVLPDVIEEGEVTQFVEKSLQAFLDHPFELAGDVFRISAKVGLALFPDDGADAGSLFDNAEVALKQSKVSGDRYLFYRMEMNEAAARKLTLENQLRRAIDNEEFVIHYQPKVNLVSSRITGVEALIRWNDPHTGMMPPDAFIPILEETGLIYEVGRWALHKAISDYLRWRAAGLPAVRIAVNVSPLQLRKINFIDEIRQVVAVSADAAAGLELEITESLIMEDVSLITTSLQAIRDLGITIAIDDFGTGFSSLSYLAKLPVDTLKIDRSFVIDMNTADGMSLVSTIIILAHSLKLTVVAEGVETEEQLLQLRSLGCDEMQGYLFSKPVPADILEARFLAPLTPSHEEVNKWKHI